MLLVGQDWTPIDTKDADATIGAHVQTFMDLVKTEKWPSPSRIGKAWLRSNLAVRCEVDPFVPLGKAFNEKRHESLIPLKHKSFNRIADFLSGVGKA